MFSLQKYCLTQKPTDDYIPIIHYSLANAQETGAIMYPDVDPISGALLIRNSETAEILYRLNNIINDCLGLMVYLHLVQLHENLYNFYLEHQNGRLLLGIYIYEPVFTIPVYIPRINSVNTATLSEPKANLAVNEQIQPDYNGMFQLDLYNYQQNNVAWMIGLEELTTEKFNFVQYPQLTKHKLQRIILQGKTVLFNQNTWHIYPLDYEETLSSNKLYLHGGLLCDEVGLGKTFSTFGLIVNTLDREMGFWNKKPTKRQLEEERSSWSETPGPTKRIRFSSTATLIVGPTRLIGQWKTELEKFMIPNHDLRVYTITSITNYRKLTAAELCNADIVIVSYRFLVNGNYHKHLRTEKDSFSLHDFYWKRIVLDEGHEILYSNHATTSVRDKVTEFKAQYKWICTGTPFSQAHDNLDYYLYFLSNKKYALGSYINFNSHILDTFLLQNTRRNTYDSVKNQIYIPPITQTTVLLNQDPVERALYVNATGEITRMIQLCTNILVSATEAEIIEDNITSLEDVRQRMLDHYQKEIDSCKRQITMCETETLKAEELYDNAGDMYDDNSVEWQEYRSAQRKAVREWKKKAKEHDKTLSSLQARQKLFNNFEEQLKEPCIICCADMTDIALTKCSHVCCRNCMDQFINQTPNNVICPMCRTPLNKGTDIGYLLATENKVDPTGNYYRHVQKWGTKMAWLIQYLEHLMKNPEHRVIIFSQWKKMLKLVGTVLEQNNIKQVYLQGSATQLAKNIERFKSSTDTRVIMLSSETCSSGSNLTEASHIILLDTVNGSATKAKAIEDQAIGRAARLGQDKKVQVVRLIMNNTIEYDYYKENIDGEGITEIIGGEGILVE